jgi:hypothetical protein
MISMCAEETTLGNVMRCVSRATRQRAKYAALLHKDKAAPDCTRGTCNPVNFTVLIKPSDWTAGHVISMRIVGKGLTLGV